MTVHSRLTKPLVDSLAKALRGHALPGETLTTLKENSEWIAKRLSSVRK